MPFCQEFQGCSCCNASHAVTIRNDMLHLSIDGSVSPQCLQDVQAHSCSVCDPWVRNACLISLPAPVSLESSFCVRTGDCADSNCKLHMSSITLSSHRHTIQTAAPHNWTPQLLHRCRNSTLALCRLVLVGSENIPKVSVTAGTGTAAKRL